MYACFGLIHLSHTESTRSETPHQLIQHRRQKHLRRFHHSALTQLMWSLNPRWLSWRGVSLRVDSVDVESQSALTLLTWSLNPRWLSWRGVSIRVDSVDVESQSALTQLTWSLTPRWLSWRGVSIRLDSVDGKSHSASTQFLQIFCRLSRLFGTSLLWHLNKNPVYWTMYSFTIYYEKIN
jgi:nucleotidyltransferase/DNA polymerase involved in DNA repair